MLRRALIPATLFVAAVFVTASQLSGVALGAGFETLTVARNLARYGQFANPFGLRQTGSTALVPPLYPAFLALLLRIFGNTAPFALAIDGITIAVHALHAALLPAVSQLFFGDRRPGIWAAVVTIVLPVFLLFPQYEIMYVATGLMLFCLAANRLVVRGGVAAALAAGAAMGLLALLNPASIALTVSWLAYLLWRYRPVHLHRFAWCAVLAAAVTLAPWTWRNYREFHKLFFVRNNLGLELYIANNDLAQASFSLNEANGCHLLMHPGRSDSESRDYQALGEVEYNRRRGAVARAWIRSHPARFAILTAQRIRMYWFPDADISASYARSIAFITLSGILGMLLLARRRQPIAVFLIGASLVYPVLYYFVQSDPRYRTPFLWIPLLAGGYFLTAVTVSARRRLQGRRTEAPATDRTQPLYPESIHTQPVVFRTF